MKIIKHALRLTVSKYESRIIFWDCIKNIIQATVVLCANQLFVRNILTDIALNCGYAGE